MTVRAEQQPVRSRRRLPIRPAYLVLLLLMGLFAYKFLEKTQEVRRLSTQAAALQNQNDRTAEENRHMQQAIKYYQMLGYVEGQARALLGYTKPGDVAVQVQPRSDHPVDRAAPSPPQVTPPPVWKQWWQTFFN